MFTTLLGIGILAGALCILEEKNRELKESKQVGNNKEHPKAYAMNSPKQLEQLTYTKEVKEEDVDNINILKVKNANKIDLNEDIYFKKLQVLYTYLSLTYRNLQKAKYKDVLLVLERKVAGDAIKINEKKINEMYDAVERIVSYGPEELSSIEKAIIKITAEKLENLLEGLHEEVEAYAASIYEKGSPIPTVKTNSTVTEKTKVIEKEEKEHNLTSLEHIKELTEQNKKETD